MLMDQQRTIGGAVELEANQFRRVVFAGDLVECRVHCRVCLLHVDGSTGHAADIVDVSTDDAEVVIGKRSAEEQAWIRSGLSEASSDEDRLQVEPELAACVLLSIECAVELQYVVSVIVIAM